VWDFGERFPGYPKVAGCSSARIAAGALLRSAVGRWHRIERHRAEILNDRVVPFYDEHGIRLSRMLTDRGTEFCGSQSHEYELYLAVEDIDHSRTKTKSPRPTASASASIAPSWTSSTGWRSARRSTAPSTSYKPTSTPGSLSTMSGVHIRAAGASATPQCRLFLTRYPWQRRKAWLLDHRRQSHWLKQPTPPDRGRDARYRAPPAQIRTCGTVG
jgi:hypothetical protein